MNLLRLSWKNLTSKPLDMALSLILFALGVGLISVLFLINKQVQDKFDKNLAGIDMVIGAKGSPLQLILCGMYHVDDPTGNITIKEAKPFLRPNHPLISMAVPLSVGDNFQSYRIIGTTHAMLDLYDGQVAEGKIWEEDYEVTIGSSVAKRLALKLGDTFFSSHGLVQDENLVHDDGGSFKVVGILEPSGSVLDQLILTNTSSIWAVHEGHDEEAAVDSVAHDHPAGEHWMDKEDNEITMVLVKFKARNFRTLNMPRNIAENTNMMAASPAIQINKLYDQLGVGMDFLQAVALAIIIVSGLSIFISLFSSLKDRQYELALMRVMGASRARLFILIILEGVLLAVVGYVIGIALSHGAMALLSGFLEESYQYQFSAGTFLAEEVYVFGGAILLGLLAAMIPAIQASQTDISETLGK